MADPSAFPNDPQVKNYNASIRKLERAIHEEKDGISSWLSLGFDAKAQKETLAALEQKLQETKRRKQSYIDHRQSLDGRPVQATAPSSSHPSNSRPQPSSYAGRDYPIRQSETNHDFRGHQQNTSLAQHSSAWNTRPQPVKSEERKEYQIRTAGPSQSYGQTSINGAASSNSSGWRSQVQPVNSYLKSEPGRGAPPLRGDSRSHLGGASQNLTVTPPAHLTPNGSSSGLSSHSGQKRDFSNARTSIDLTSPGRSKRHRGSESPSPYSSSPSASRPDSRNSLGSGVIDLTGSDDEIQSSIDRFKQQVERPARARSTQNGYGMPTDGMGQRASLMQPDGRSQWPLPPVQRQYSFQQPGANHNYVSPTPGAPFSNLPSVPPTTNIPDSHHTPSRYGPSFRQPTGFRPASSIMPGSFPSDLNPISLDSDDDEALSFLSARPVLSQPPRPERLPSAYSLSNVINRTNNYDFSTMTDGYGNPLPYHTSAAAATVYDEPDPSASKAELEQLMTCINQNAGANAQGDSSPEGLRYPLYEHQKRALRWMKATEEDHSRGGILADDMGLGKTISMLALILSCPAKLPEDDDDLFGEDAGREKVSPFCKTNLIIAPKALIRQWEDEIKKKVRPGYELSVFVHHGSQKAPAQELLKYDVVLTTYQTLLADHMKLLKFWKSNEGRLVNTEKDPTLARNVSFFHPRHSKFYRIILDESQVIKNHKSKTTIAACGLVADFKWCMSGTPIMNSVEELYPIFKFIGIKKWSEFKAFKKAFGAVLPKPPKSMNTNGNRQDAMKTLQATLTATMLRRSKTSQIDGKPILELPNKSEETVYVEFNEDEQQFYQELKANAQVKVNKYLREGTLGKHYRYILVLLLRLRQSCCHPHLLLDVHEDGAEVDEKMLALARTLPPQVVQRFKEKTLAIIEKADHGFECPICYDTLADPRIPFPCGHEICAGCLQTHISNANQANIRSGEENSDVKCAVCRVPLQTDNLVTYTAFKKVHMPDLLEDDPDDDAESEDSDDSDDSDHDDADKFGNLNGFVVPDSEDEEIFVHPRLGPVNASKAVSSTPTKKKKKQKIKASMLKTLRREAKKNAKAARQYRRYLDKNWLPSAKVDACLNLLRKIKNESDGEKTLVFSQWTMFLDLIEVGLAREDDLKSLKAIRYDGEMSMAQRDEAFRQFRDDDDTKVLLVSLRAGNAGLNLVSASRVIIMDPFWNPYIEMQAVDRAYRIGQRKEVKVYRLLIKDTVEDRIMDLQENKRAMVDQALDEKAAKTISGLTLTELRNLFLT